MSRVKALVAKAFQKAKTAHGVDVLYIRNDATIGPIDAIPTKPRNITGNLYGTQTAYCDREYLIETALLAIDDKPIEPRSGDVIIENGIRYTVAECEGANQCFQPADTTGVFLRIFTFNR